MVADGRDIQRKIAVADFLRGEYRYPTPELYQAALNEAIEYQKQHCVIYGVQGNYAVTRDKSFRQ